MDCKMFPALTEQYYACALKCLFWEGNCSHKSLVFIHTRKKKNRQAVHNWEFCSCILNAAAVDQKQWLIFSLLSPQGKRTTEEYIWRHQCCQKDCRGRIKNGQAGSHDCWQCKLLKFYPKGFDIALDICSNNPIILRELCWSAPSTLCGLNRLTTSVATTLKLLYWMENSGTNFVSFVARFRQRELL